MPALPAVSDTVRVSLIGSLAEDSLVVSRFYMRYFTGSPPADLDTAATAIAGHWNTDLAAATRSDYTLTQVELEDLTSATSPVGVAVTSHAGTRSGVKLTASASALLRFKVGRRYRGGHPRLYYVGGVQSDTLDAQTWQTTYLSTLVTAWNTFIAHVVGDLNTAYGASDFAQVNVSFYQGFTNVTYPSGRTYPRPTTRATPVVDDVISVTANPKVASQRRRNLTP